MDAIKHSNTGKSRKRSKTNSDADDDETFISNHNFVRFHVITSTAEDRPLSALSPFVLGKALYSQIGTLKTVKKMQRGDVLVETDNRIETATAV